MLDLSDSVFFHCRAKEFWSIEELKKFQIRFTAHEERRLGKCDSHKTLKARGKRKNGK